MSPPLSRAWFRLARLAAVLTGGPAAGSTGAAAAGSQSRRLLGTCLSVCLCLIRSIDRIELE